MLQRSFKMHLKKVLESFSRYKFFKITNIFKKEISTSQFIFLVLIESLKDPKYCPTKGLYLLIFLQVFIGFMSQKSTAEIGQKYQIGLKYDSRFICQKSLKTLQPWTFFRPVVLEKLYFFQNFIRIPIYFIPKKCTYKL